jgi:hypothetical protein
MRRTLPLLVCTLAAGLLLQDLSAPAQSPKSDPAPKLIGGPFLATVVSGKRIKALRESIKEQLEKQFEKQLEDKAISREKVDAEIKEAVEYYNEFPHDPVTEFGLNPVVGIFVRVEAVGKGLKEDTLTAEQVDEEIKKAVEPSEEAVGKLLQKVEKAVRRYKDAPAPLHAFAILLSPQAHSAATAEKAKDTKGLIKEALWREGLTKYASQLAENLKLDDVVVGILPPGKVKDYRLPDKAGVTVLVYAKHVVLHSYEFADGEFSDADIDRVLKDVTEVMKQQRRPKSKG